MEDKVIIERAVAACMHRCQRMAYLKGGSDTERDAYTVNRALLAFWQDKAGSLAPEEEAEVALAAKDLINRNMLKNPVWHEYQKMYAEQLTALPASAGRNLEVRLAIAAGMTWRDLAEDQISRIKQDFHYRDKVVEQKLGEDCKDPNIMFHVIERLEIREITGLVTEQDVRDVETYSQYLPDWRERLEAVYYSRYDEGVINKQFMTLFFSTYLIMPAGANDGSYMD